MAFKKAAVFTPVIMFTPETSADRLAIKLIHTLQGEVRATMNTERSKQTIIGISEIGSSCRKCVARKLSQEYIKIDSPSWKAQVGTFIHAGLEEHFQGRFGHLAAEHEARLSELPEGEWNLTAEQRLIVDKFKAVPASPDTEPTDERPHYFMERRLAVFDHGTLHLGGSCDLFVLGKTFAVVVDWKTQGAPKLVKSGKGDIGPTYTVQMHTYGLGYEKLGFPVTHVLMYALPRDGELEDAKPVLMRYDRQVALDALARLAVMVDAAKIVGWDAVIAAQPRAVPCWDCQSYEGQETDNFLNAITGGTR